MPKNIVIDANILISTLLGSKINLKVLHFMYGIYAPYKLVEEVMNNKKLVCEKGKCNSQDFDDRLSALLKCVKIIEYMEYERCMTKATEALGPQHPADIHYLACALHVKAAFIWTHDKDFSRQLLVPAKTTKQILIRMKTFKYLDHLISSKMRER